MTLDKLPPRIYISAITVFVIVFFLSVVYSATELAGIEEGFESSLVDLKVQEPSPILADSELHILAGRIIHCESGWRSNAQNSQSTAGGLGQFLTSTWKSTMIKMGLPPDSDKYDPILNYNATIFLLKEQGTRPWDESKHCWTTF